MKKKNKSDVVVLGAGYSGIISAYFVGDCTIIERNNELKLTENPSFSVHRFIPGICIRERFLWGLTGFSNSDDYYSLKVYGKFVDLDLRFKTVSKIKIWSFDDEKILKKVLKNINFGVNIVSGSLKQKSLTDSEGNTFYYDVLISTIPLPVLLRIYNIQAFDSLKFVKYPIGIIKRKVDLGIDYSFQIYDPSFMDLFYRIYYCCVNKVMFEEYSLANPACGNMKFDVVLDPGRIEKTEGKDLVLIREMLKENGIYLVGRYALWNPDFLVEDIPSFLQEEKISIARD